MSFVRVANIAVAKNPTARVMADPRVMPPAARGYLKGGSRTT